MHGTQEQRSVGRLVRVDERADERTIVAPFPSRQAVLEKQAA